MFGFLVEEIRLEAKDKARQWRAQSAAGGDTPSGEHRRLAGPTMKRHGADLDAIDKARKTGKVTGKAKRGVRQLRKFNTQGDELSGREARAKVDRLNGVKGGKNRRELSTGTWPKLPR
jgi:hypothetical protein